jgi:hypothetical protein
MVNKASIAKGALFPLTISYIRAHDANNHVRKMTQSKVRQLRFSLSLLDLIFVFSILSRISVNITFAKFFPHDAILNQCLSEQQ